MAVHIGTERQLFLDDHVVESTDGLGRVQQQPDKLDLPVIVGDKPWEQSKTAINGNSLHYDTEEECYKAWYDTGGGVAYAISSDGIDWEKPRLGIIEKDGSRDNNLVSAGRGFSVVKDIDDEDPSRKYKAMYWHSRREPEMPWGGKGHFVAFSADGIHWKDHPENPVVDYRNGLTDGQFVLGRDPNHGKYVAYMRPGVEFYDPPKRTSAWVASDDFVNWGPPVLAVAPDDEDGVDTEYYRMTVAKYEGVYIGFIWVYYNDVEFADQSRDTMLAFSRNGISWSKPCPTDRFLGRGRKGDWDSEFAMACKLIPFEDELRVFYSGGNIPHDVKGADGKKGSVRDWPGSVIDGEYRAYAVGLAKLRRDGFVAIQPQASEGTLTTRPLTFLGSRLRMNADSTKGRIEVEVLDERGRLVEGYSRADCIPVSADSTDHTVRWTGGRDLVHADDTAADIGGSNWTAFKSRLRQPVRLRFYLNDAKMYSFWVE